MKPIRTFIWGSCVSRDTSETYAEWIEVVRYVARQSWISANRAAAGVIVEGLESNFQRRMTQGDIQGNGLRELARFGNDVDLVLFDLCDERLGVVEIGGGAVTRSVEKVACGAQGTIDATGEVLTFGSDEHFRRWIEAAEEVHESMRRLGLLEKSLVLAPEWALYDEEAKPTPTSFGMLAFEINQLYERYYQALETMGFSVARITPTVAGTSHKWGLAPFHYHPATYEQMFAAITAHVSREATH